jgi:serine/threonine protein kinase
VGCPVERNKNSECLPPEIVAGFVAGALDGAEVREVEAHLAECAACAGVVADAAYGAGDEGVDTLASRQPAAPLLEPGTLWAGKYRIERLLGRGGMASVFSAFHEELGHRVAIKVLHSDDSGAATRLIREAQTTARLGGAHVPRVFDLGRLPGGAPYIVMEYLIGEDLSQVLARGPVAPWEAVGYVLQACAVLGPVHAAGVVHRDLKPANLFLVAQEGGAPVLKVLDFGISKGGFQDDSAEAQSLTSTGAIVGSPMYMSPEQIRASKDVDARSDLWSLGVILHELVTGDRPFHGATLSALAIAIATEPPSRPGAVRPGIPPGLERAILRCLEKDRSARFQSVEALSRALAPFAAPADAAPLGVASRERALPAVIGAVALATVAALAWAALEIHARSSLVDVPAPTLAISSPASATSGSSAPPSGASAPPAAPPPASSTSATPAVTRTSLTVPPLLATTHAASAHGAPRPAAPSATPAAPKPAASAPCKLVKTVDKEGESHFSCPCLTCQ